MLDKEAPRSSILYQPSRSSNLPFPSRVKKQKKNEKDERLLFIFKQIHINLQFPEAMIHMPKGSKVLKDLSHKEKLKKVACSDKLSEECSAIIQTSLPRKEGDPGSFTLPCLIEPLAVKNALANLGASINLMPHSLFQRFGISTLNPTRMSIQLADRSIKYPIRVCENLLVKTTLPRHSTSCIDVHEGKLSQRVRNETVTFNIEKPLKSSYFRDDYLYYTDHTAKLFTEQWVDIIDHDGKWVETEEDGDPKEVQAVSFHPRTETIKPLEWKALRNQLRPSSIEPPELELKELHEHLEYAILQENVVISFVLSTIEKARLLEVLKNYKGAIAWSIADIKGIDSSFCTHKILMEDEFKLSV
nr:hypothetical protein [Tanacetum cinerariifolium]GEX52478.1 hypothetical protein [Tanacetum cinerariifolium]GEX53054.1 hypothetical protein [Tanacetum cinerariifolium]